MNFTRDQVVAVLKQKVCAVQFEKVSGETSKMICTLVEGELPPRKGNFQSSKAPTNETLVTVWNTEKKAWRCFHADKIVGPIEIIR